jgi:hypothetical protein
MSTAFLSGQNDLVPSGVITIWSGSVASIPTGWNLCDGTNGTPDLRNKFVVVSGGTYAVGATGGQASQTISSHSHTYSGSTGGVSNMGPYTFKVGGYDYPALEHSHSFSGTTSSDGSVVVNLLPPYYALCYVMKV